MKKIELKRKELRLLSFFRHNARLALTRISRETGVPVSTIFDKLKKYENNIITKHTSLIDFSKLGYNTRATIFLKTNAPSRTELGIFLKKHPNVNNVFRVNNGFDFLIEGIFKTIKDLEKFLENIELTQEITAKEVYFVIDELSRENFMAEIT